MSTVSGKAGFVNNDFAFRSLPDKCRLLKIAQLVLHLSGVEVSDYAPIRQWRTDAGDILMRLIETPESWHDRFELAKTPNGGMQLDFSTRVHELRKALNKHGLSIVCLMDTRGERNKSFFRLCYEDETPKSERTGRVTCLTVKEGTKACRQARSTEQSASPRRRDNAGWHSSEFRNFRYGQRDAGRPREDIQPQQATLLGLAILTTTGIAATFLDFERGKLDW